MKKILLVLTLMLTTLSYSQSRLWYTYAEIKKEFQNTYEFTTGYAEGLGKYLQFETGDAVVAYYFNESNLCYLTTYIPLTEGRLHYLVEEYNKKYVIQSENEWKVYTNGSTVTVELKYVDNSGYYFLYY